MLKYFVLKYPIFDTRARLFSYLIKKKLCRFAPDFVNRWGNFHKKTKIIESFSNQSGFIKVLNS